MGAGKSAVGRQLALSLSKEFFDSDHSIVERTGVDIAYIFEKEGEEGFRKREIQIINELTQRDNIVLSTGGGSLVRPENRESIAQAGTVIYLHATVEQQACRTKKKDNRPLLHTEDPKAVLAKLMYEREKHYREVSDIVITTDGQRVETVVKKILKKLEVFTAGKSTISDKRETVIVKTVSKEYPINISDGLLHASETLLDALPKVVVTDENIDVLYRKKIEEKINPLAWLVVPASEKSKSIQHYQWLLEQLLELGVKRDCQLVGIGGGVVGDLTGFVAATYMRGMQLVHVPTSLLAMVDSSIGGKTGINFAQGKNLVGSIYQPNQVLIDLSFIKTLPQHEYVSGLAEVIKYALIHKPDFLTYLESNSDKIKDRDIDVLRHVVAECVKSKANIVALDEKDLGTRMLLNLGHTFGHAIEKLQAYAGHSHGEAVAIGMCMAADVSHELGHITSADVSRIKKLCKSFHLPTNCPVLMLEDFLDAMTIDKKNTSNQTRFILLKNLGEAYIEDSLDPVILEKVLKTYLKPA